MTEPYDPDYDEIYSDPAARPPWDIGGPQPALAAVLDDEVKGPRVLDVGCGPGDLAIALARRGYEVTAVDVSRVAIDAARARAVAEGLPVSFEVRDATALSPAAGPFDSIFDSGLLHSLMRHDRRSADAYLARLPVLAAPGAAVFVLAVSLEAGHGFGVTREFLRTAFGEPRWTGTRIDDIAVTARTDGREHALGGFLLRTTRAAGT